MGTNRDSSGVVRCHKVPVCPVGEALQWITIGNTDFITTCIISFTGSLMYHMGRRARNIVINGSLSV